MTYVDGFVIVIKKGQMPNYRKMARLGAKIWKKYGALHYIEAVGDDLHPNMGGMNVRTFPKMTKPKKGEKIIFSFITFKSRKHRDQVNAKVMKDPAMNDPTNNGMPMPFDMKKMAYGGFKAFVEW